MDVMSHVRLGSKFQVARCRRVAGDEAKHSKRIQDNAHGPLLPLVGSVGTLTSRSCWILSLKLTSVRIFTEIRSFRKIRLVASANEKSIP